MLIGTMYNGGWTGDEMWDMVKWEMASIACRVYLCCIGSCKPACELGETGCDDGGYIALECDCWINSNSSGHSRLKLSP
jgi:hypothetical protein